LSCRERNALIPVIGGERVRVGAKGEEVLRQDQSIANVLGIRKREGGPQVAEAISKKG